MKKDSKMPYYYDDGGGSRIGQFWRSIPAVTRNIIMVNVIMFIATLVNEDFMVGCFSLFYPASPHFRWWQCITHMFMHGGFWHIFFNMYSLYIFGRAVENIVGRERFAILYFLSGLGAAAAQIGVQALSPSLQMVPTVGASGCIYGVIVAFAMIFPEARMTLIFPPMILSAKWMAIIFIGIELLTGVTGTQAGVAHFAHLGGALVGFLLIWWWYKRPKNNNTNSYVHY